MKTNDTETLVGTERRLKPFSLSAAAMLHGAGAISLLAAVRSGLTLPVIALSLAYLALTYVNLRTFSGLGPSIGGVVVAVFALLPASIAGALSFPAGVIRGTCLVAAVVSCAVTSYFLVWFYRIWGAYRNAPEVAPDANLVVLGGLIKGGKPVPTLASRLNVAAELWRTSPERTIVVTGGPTLDDEVTEADAMARWLTTEEGIPQERIILEPEALNTEQNLAYSNAALQHAGLADHQLCIVSSDYHLYRALTIARRMGLDPIGVPAPTAPKTRLQQWCREVLVILTKL